MLLLLHLTLNRLNPTPSMRARPSKVGGDKNPIPYEEPACASVRVETLNIERRIPWFSCYCVVESLQSDTMVPVL